MWIIPKSRQRPSPSQLPPGCHETFRLKSVRLVAVRDNSLVYRCDSAHGELAVKWCLDCVTGQPDPSGAQIEYDSLQRLSEATKNAGEAPLSAAPVGLLAEEAVLAMTWESGKPMTQVILSASCRDRKAMDCGAMAGDWLRRFHRLCPLPEQGNDFQSTFSYLNEQLEVGKVTNDRFLRRVRQLLESHVVVAGEVRIPSSWAFGDFKADNLLVTGSEVLAIDVQLKQENTVIYNLVQFLLHLDLLRWSGRGFLNWQGITQTSQGFLAAYSPAASNWHLPIAWLKSAMLVLRWIASAQDQSPGGRLRGIALRRALVRAVGELERC